VSKKKGVNSKGNKTRIKQGEKFPGGGTDRDCTGRKCRGYMQTGYIELRCRKRGKGTVWRACQLIIQTTKTERDLRQSWRPVERVTRVIGRKKINCEGKLKKLRRGGEQSLTTPKKRSLTAASRKRWEVVHAQT